MAGPLRWGLTKRLGLSGTSRSRRNCSEPSGIWHNSRQAERSHRCGTLPGTRRPSGSRALARQSIRDGRSSGPHSRACAMAMVWAGSRFLCASTHALRPWALKTCRPRWTCSLRAFSKRNYELLNRCRGRGRREAVADQPLTPGNVDVAVTNRQSRQYAGRRTIAMKTTPEENRRACQKHLERLLEAYRELTTAKSCNEGAAIPGGQRRGNGGQASRMGSRNHLRVGQSRQAGVRGAWAPQQRSRGVLRRVDEHCPEARRSSRKGAGDLNHRTRLSVFPRGLSIMAGIGCLLMPV